EPFPRLPVAQSFGDELAENPTATAGAVNSGTGSYAYRAVDVSIPGIEVPFTLSRSYNSMDTTTGDLGPGWQYSYGAKLTVLGNGNVQARAGDGQQFLYVKQADGSFRAYFGGTSTLALFAGVYTLTEASRASYLF